MRWKALVVALAMVPGMMLWGAEGTSPVADVAQVVTLKSGWNAFWLGVTIEDQSPDEVFKSWPVESVSAYQSDVYAQLAQYVASQSEEALPTQPFLVWHRDEALASTLKMVRGDLVYVVEASEEFATTLRGRPVGRRMVWKTGLNYFGFSPAEGVSVSATDALAGLPVRVVSLQKITGTGETPSTIPFGTFASEKVKRGDALIVEVDGGAKWSGAFELSATQGLSFGEDSVLTRLQVTNTSGTTCSFTLEHLGYNGNVATRALQLYIRDREVVATSSGWTLWVDPLTKELEAGEVWDVEIGLDRTAMGETKVAITDIVQCTASNAGKHCEMIPILANDMASHSGDWPKGVWAVSMAATTVSTSSMTDGTLKDAKVEKAMPLNLLLHARDNGAELLQRLTVATLPNETAGSRLIVYAPNATVDGQAEVSMQLSTPLLPTDVPVVPLLGTFDESVTATWTVAADSPSNPFRHPYHPEHDGLSADYKEAAPSGDDFANYTTSSIKPELWSIKNALTLNWDDRGDEQWSPEETLTGTFTWTLEGLRASGAIKVSGVFSMRRILISPEYREAK